MQFVFGLERVQGAWNIGREYGISDRRLPHVLPAITTVELADSVCVVHNNRVSEAKHSIGTFERAAYNVSNWLARHYFI